jgi:hypothetical protein
MSENLWVEFDKKIAALGTKADELEQMKGKLQNVPERLVNVKAQIKKLRESAQGLASKSVRTEIQKDIQKKVEELDKIFKKLESTKTTGDPILAKLETALGDLENYTVVKDSEIKPESTPEMKPASSDNVPPAAAASSTDKRGPPPEQHPRRKNPLTKPVAASITPAAKPSYSDVVKNAGPFQPDVKPDVKPAWNPSTKLGGYFSHKKYSKKRKMKKQHKSKKHKKATKSRKVHKLKKNKSRRYRR